MEFWCVVFGYLLVGFFEVVFVKEFVLSCDDFLQFLMSLEDGVQYDVFGELVGSGFDYDDGFFGVDDDEVEVGDVVFVVCWVEDEVIVDYVDVDSVNGVVEGD